MAITINGSGTVTGLSVGGLPDGTVDAGTLATDSVTSAKILNATIASGDLASGVAGAGKVLQVVSTLNTTYASSTTTNSWLDASLSLSITPTLSTSKILVSTNEGVYGDCDVDGHSTYGGYRILRDSTAIVESTTSKMFSRGGQAPAPTIGISYLDSPNTTASVTYKTQVYNNSSSNRTMRINQFENATITLMEIAQ